MKHLLASFWRQIKYHFDKSDYWDKPLGCCSQCGAPLNQNLVGGYRLHDGETSVSWDCNAIATEVADMQKRINKRVAQLNK